MPASLLIYFLFHLLIRIQLLTAVNFGLEVSVLRLNLYFMNTKSQTRRASSWSGRHQAQRSVKRRSSNTNIKPYLAKPYLTGAQHFFVEGHVLSIPRVDKTSGSKSLSFKNNRRVTKTFIRLKNLSQDCLICLIKGCM